MRPLACPLGEPELPIAPGRQLKAGQGVGFVVFDVEQFVELGDRKDFVDLWPDVAQFQFPAVRFDLFVERDELAERGTRKKLNGRKIEQEILAVLFLDQLE
jgi:hypothetical protein